MNDLLAVLSEAMGAGVWLAIAGSFAWGVCSIILSPCHLSSIPLVVGFLVSQSQNSLKRSLFISLLFAIGVLVTIGVIGIITALMGRMLGDIGPYGKYLVALVFLLVGIYLMDVVKLPNFGFGLKPLDAGSAFLTALLLGLVFGLALGPCTFAFLAPVLGLVFQLSNTHLPFAIGLLSAFALGHCLVIAGVGVLATRIQSYLDWSYRSSAIAWIKRAAGGLLILGGIYAFTTA